MGTSLWFVYVWKTMTWRRNKNPYTWLNHRERSQRQLVKINVAFKVIASSSWPSSSPPASALLGTGDYPCLSLKHSLSRGKAAPPTRAADLQNTSAPGLL
jgi:hypothetical protein